MALQSGFSLHSKKKPDAFLGKYFATRSALKSATRVTSATAARSCATTPVTGPAAAIASAAAATTTATIAASATTTAAARGQAG